MKQAQIEALIKFFKSLPIILIACPDDFPLLLRGEGGLRGMRGEKTTK